MAPNCSCSTLGASPSRRCSCRPRAEAGFRLHPRDRVGATALATASRTSRVLQLFTCSRVPRQHVAPLEALFGGPQPPGVSMGARRVSAVRLAVMDLPAGTTVDEDRVFERGAALAAELSHALAHWRGPSSNPVEICRGSVGWAPRSLLPGLTRRLWASRCAPTTTSRPN